MAFKAPAAIKNIRTVLENHGMRIDHFYIVEGSAEGQGYHHSREDLDRRFGKGKAYSVQHELDRGGDDENASAFDIVSNQATLQGIAARVLEAGEKKDKRVYRVLRDFGGSLDGKKVTAYRLYDQTFISFDNSHLSHFHGSIHRNFSGDTNACLGIAEVVAGVAPGTFGWKDPSPVAPKVPFKVGDKLETKTSATAYYDTKGKVRATVAKGYKVTVKDLHLVNNVWWVESTTYFYKASDLQKVVVEAPKVIGKYWVNTDTLNVRSSGNTDSSKNIVGTAKRDQKVSGYEVKSDGRVWVVDSKGNYFAREYLLPYVTYAVTADKLNVRSGPGTSYDVVDQRSKGDYVLVTKIQNGWGSDKLNKWHSMEYLKKA